MKLNPNNYRRTLDKLRQSILDANEKGKDLHTAIVEISVASNVPIQATVRYALRNDCLGSKPELINLMNNNRKFYKYEEVTEWSDEKENKKTSSKEVVIPS